MDSSCLFCSSFALSLRLTDWLSYRHLPTSWPHCVHDRTDLVGTSGMLMGSQVGRQRNLLSAEMHKRNWGTLMAAMSSGLQNNCH